MDKKNHLRQGSNKVLTSECRKSTDTNKQLWPRNARRRENSNLSNSKADPQRSSKPGYAKTRPNVDKRPKPRGGAGVGSKSCISSFNVATSTRLAEGDVSDEYDLHNFEIEQNSVYTQGSKKQNLNHLLNFHYGPKEDDNPVGHISSRIGNKQNSRKHRYNKEQFLQANFQFVINSNAEVDIIASSSDTLIDWSLIEQINIQTTEEPQCPICLYPPIAAKLTRCGHAYCWPCILHYLALTDKPWRKCPICYDAIHTNDLKSTVIVQQNNFSVGDLIKLQLMRREKGSMFIEKVDNKEADEKIPHISANIDKKKFSKFLLAGPCEVLSIIDREKTELESIFDESCPEFIFIQQALDLLEKRRGGISEKPVEHDQKIDESKVNANSTSNISQRENMDEISTTQVEETISSNELCKMKETSKYYYFYQCVDGQNIFLHSLNVKMLQSMYGSLNQGPLAIEGKILQKESLSMDADLRKKFACLAHLPLTCQFEVVEVQLEPPTVSESVLDMYKDDILVREKIRMRRAREEKKREKEINEINERQMGRLISRSANIDIKSTLQFPTCGYDAFPSTSVPYDATQSPLMLNSPQQSPFSHTSFANVLSASKEDFWPSLDGASSVSSSFVESKIPWYTPPKHHNRSSESENFGDLDVETNYNKQNLGDVIADALLNTKLESNLGTSGKKRKNKSKKTLLFSTGMNFNGN